jgi:predicted ABC-type sugar transport system permease subunit
MSVGVDVKVGNVLVTALVVSVSVSAKTGLSPGMMSVGMAMIVRGERGSQ